MHRVSVSRVFSQLFDGSFGNLYCDFVNSVIIVAVFREISLCSVVNDYTVFISDRINLCIFDGGKGVCRNGKARNAECHKALKFGI